MSIITVQQEKPAKKKMSEKQRKANVARVSEWRREHCKTFSVQCHKIYDADIIEHMQKQPNKRLYLIRLIRKDIMKDAE